MKLKETAVESLKIDCVVYACHKGKFLHDEEKKGAGVKQMRESLSSLITHRFSHIPHIRGSQHVL